MSLKVKIDFKTKLWLKSWLWEKNDLPFTALLFF